MGNYCFGIDVGGTTVKMGLFRIDGQVLDKWEIPTRTENGGKAILPYNAAQELYKRVQNSLAHGRGEDDE